MVRFFHRFVLAALLAAMSACGPTGVPVEYLLFLDLSGSVSPAQRDAWVGSAEAALNKLDLGDSIIIFPIHDRTLEAAPLFRARVPGKGLDLIDWKHAQAALDQARHDARAALQEALSGSTRSRGTQLFEVVDKLAAALPAERPVARRVFIFSDFLHCAPDRCFERTKIGDQDHAALVRELQSRYGWASDALQGVTVYGVLNASTSGGSRPVNDHRVLKQFWQMLFQQLGAELASFDTYLSLE